MEQKPHAATPHSSLHIAMVGAGGLGVTAALGLLAGWPDELPLTLEIYDPDQVELSNLNRQVLFQESDLGAPKAERLCARLAEWPGLLEGKQVQLIPIQRAVDETSIERLEGASLILDCCDSAVAKFLLNDFCVPRGIPFCYAGAIGTGGLLLFVAPDSRSGCLRCLFPDFDAVQVEQQSARCRDAGVLGPVVGAVGLLQAEQALAYILTGRLPATPLVRLDYPEFQPRETSLPPAAECPHGCAGRNVRRLDLRDRRCPSTFLYTKFALERIQNGSMLEVHFGDHASAGNVTRTVTEQGHPARLLGRDPAAGSWRMLVMKRGSNG